MHRFCREECQHVCTAIESLNDIAGRIFWEGLKVHHISQDKFLQSHGAVSRYFNKYCRHLVPELRSQQALSQMDSGTTRLDTLASAAISQPGHSDQSMSFPTLPTSGSHSQTRAGYIDVPYKPGPQPSAVQHSGSGQDIEHSWREYTNPSWSPNAAAPGFSMTGADTARTNPFDQTVIGDFTTPTTLTNNDVAGVYWSNEWFGEFVENFEG